MKLNLVITFCLALTLTSQVNADIVHVADTVVATGSLNRSFDVTLDGYSTAITSGVTTEANASTFTNNTFGRYTNNNIDNQTITYNYGGLDDVDGILFYNYWESGQAGNEAVLNRGVNTTSVTVTHSGGTTTFDGVTFTDEQVQDPVSVGASAQNFDFGQEFDGVTAIAFSNVNSSDSRAGFTGVLATTVAAVPEPSSLAVLGLGIIGFVVRRRR